jgi:hypothetical protein
LGVLHQPIVSDTPVRRLRTRGRDPKGYAACVRPPKVPSWRDFGSCSDTK